MRTLASHALIVLLTLTASSVSAATGTLSSVTIEKLIVSEDRFGGCMAMLSRDIATAVPSCPDKWVTFACDGSLDNSIARAMQKWEIAQLGYALGKNALIQADSDRTVNGYCFATIIRLEP